MDICDIRPSPNPVHGALGFSLFCRFIVLISFTLLLCRAWRMRRYATLAHTITPSATLVRTAVGGLSGVVVGVQAIHRWTF